MTRRLALPFLGGAYIATTIDGWRMLRFVAGLALVIVLAKLLYNCIEDYLAWRSEERHLRGDVAELIERWSFPGDTAAEVAARLRGMTYVEVGDAVQIMRAEREEAIAKHHRVAARRRVH